MTENLTTPKLIKNLERIQKKLYTELSLLESQFIDTDPSEEYDNSNKELEIDQIKEMIATTKQLIECMDKSTLQGIEFDRVYIDDALGSDETVICEFKRRARPPGSFDIKELFRSKNSYDKLMARDWGA